MSHIIPINKVNQFLPQDKLEVTAHEQFNDLEETARDIVLSQLAAIYDVSTWLDQATTPSMVANIIGLLVAGWVYDRQFSEEAASGNSYGQRRVEEAYALLNGLLEGAYTLQDAEPVVDGTATGTPSYYATEPVFEMGEAF